MCSCWNYLKHVTHLKMSYASSSHSKRYSLLFDVCIYLFFNFFLDFTLNSQLAPMKEIFNFHFAFICNRNPNFIAFNFHFEFYFRLGKQLQRTIKCIYHFLFVSERCSFCFFLLVMYLAFVFIEKRLKRVQNGDALVWMCEFSMFLRLFFCCVLCIMWMCSLCMSLCVYILCIH